MFDSGTSLDDIRLHWGMGVLRLKSDNSRAFITKDFQLNGREEYIFQATGGKATRINLAVILI